MAARRKSPAPRTRAAARTSSTAWWARLVVPLVSGGVVIAAALLGVRQFILGSGYFVVRQVQASNRLRVPLARSLLGQNLWRVNLPAVQRSTALANPAFKGVRVWRAWPQRIVVEAWPRTPVAQIRTSQYYLVDEEGFLLPQGAPSPMAQLPIVDGIEMPGVRLVPGQVNTAERLKVALAALRAWRAAPDMRAHRLLRLDVANPSQVTLYLDDGLEARLGPLADWPRRLPQLRRTLETLAQKQLAPAYIDLRFGEDPIIGPPR